MQHFSTHQKTNSAPFDKQHFVPSHTAIELRLFDPQYKTELLNSLKEQMTCLTVSFPLGFAFYHQNHDFRQNESALIIDQRSSGQVTQKNVMFSIIRQEFRCAVKFSNVKSQPFALTIKSIFYHYTHERAYFFMAKGEIISMINCFTRLAEQVCHHSVISH